MVDTRLVAPLDRPTGLSSVLATAAGLALGPAVAIGFARFAYALLLPGMRADLAWTFGQAGAMNTANALGYLFGALVAAATARRFGARPAFASGIVVTAALLLLSAVTTSFPALLLLRVVAGVAGAVTFIAGAGLVAHLGGREAGRSSLLLALYFAGGGGLGIFISALAVNPLLTIAPHGWRLGWASLGGLSILALLAAVPALRRVDEIPAAPPVAARAGSLQPLLFTFGAYTLFGAGYIAYITFIVALLRAEGAGSGIISVFWALLGLAAIASPVLWGPVLARLAGGRGLALTMLVLALGAILPVANPSGVAALLSALLFGGSFLNVVTAVTTVARRVLPPPAWTGGIAALTVVFAIGQCIGPLLSGVLADRSGGLRLGLALSAGLLLLGALVALGQRQRQH
ncbi:MAG TPA: YbfB/YjiJ family MFS transporter [Chloroflexota bacterium]|jgi:predicted MFS family arabinose efflux permease|nr:YbfB/YjiJ family MFS transporter [Chloroflexota bacterium]